MSLIGELKRRNVLRVGAAYVVAGWLIIQVVETIFPAFGFGDAAVRITTVVLTIGLIPTLIFAWAFELTPEGLKKEKEVDRSQSITNLTGKKLDRMVMVILAIALAYFVFDRFVLDPQREAALKRANVEAVERARDEGHTDAVLESFGDKSIAVLAFEDMSPERDQEYLSDGIAEELLNLLAKIPELRVISRTSAFSYKGKDAKLVQIAEELNVAHILEGSVRKAGSRVRITAQLIEARSDTHLWSDTYDRVLDDIFVIQDEIAAKVVEQLRIEILGEAPRVTETDPEAYALYLQAEHLKRKATFESWEQSAALYERALAIEPDYPPALVGLAINYADQANADLRPLDETLTLIRQILKKALAIDPNYARAHSLLSNLAMIYESDLAAAAKHLRRALEIDPVNTYSAQTLLTLLGRPEQAIAVGEYETARDPVNPNRYLDLALPYLIAGRWDDAIAAAQTALRLSPGAFAGHYYIGVALLFKGEPEAALGEFGKERDAAYRLKGKALALHALGREDKFRENLQKLIERVGRVWPSEVAHVYAYVGDVDAAYQWLQASVANEMGGFIPQEPFLASLSADPRWLPLLEEMGKSPAQLAAIDIEITLPN